MQTAIYSLRDPETGVTRYIGKTIAKLPTRLDQHLSKARRGCRTHRGRWINSILKNGGVPRIDLIEMVDGDGCAEEIKWISFMREHGFDLVNGTLGGESGMTGRTHPPEIRAIISAKGTGRKHSSETIAKRASKLRGQHRSIEERKHISESKRGTTFSIESRKKMSESRKGKTLLPEIRLKCAERFRAMDRRGEKSPLAKLSEQDVREIKGSLLPQSTLAKTYGVGQDQISRIKSGKRWAHVQ